MKKGLIFGGIALVVGVGAYLWYKSTLKNIKEEAASDKAPKKSTEDKAVVYNKKGIEINDKAGARDKYNNRDATFFSDTTADAWKDRLPFGA